MKVSILRIIFRPLYWVKGHGSHKWIGIISKEMLFEAKLVVSKKEKYGFLVLSPLGEKIVVLPEWIWAPGLFSTIPTRPSNYHLVTGGLKSRSPRDLGAFRSQPRYNRLIIQIGFVVQV